MKASLALNLCGALPFDPFLKDSQTMKKLLLPTILACAFAALPSPLALAQWDNRQSVLDNIVDHRLDMRRTRARMEANRKRGRTTRKGTSSRRRAGARRVSTARSKPVAPPLPPYRLELLRDSGQDFAREDPTGFKTNLTFTSLATGKTISKSAYCKIDTGFQTDTTIEGIPAGTYMVRAEVAYQGTKYQAHIGSKEGSTENPKGGDFAPSFKVVFKSIIDEGGSRVMGVFPPKIHIRALEDTGVKWTS